MLLRSEFPDVIIGTGELDNSRGEFFDSIDLSVRIKQELLLYL